MVRISSSLEWLFECVCSLLSIFKNALLLVLLVVWKGNWDRVWKKKKKKNLIISSYFSIWLQKLINLIFLFNSHKVNFFGEKKLSYYICGGQNLRLCVGLKVPLFNNNAFEEKDNRVDKYPRVLVQEGHPPRIWHMSVKWVSSYPRPPSRKLQQRR